MTTARGAGSGGKKFQRTRESIIRAAREVFREQGYVDASVQHIIERCGISRGGFYHHFRSKDHVFRSVVARVVNHVGEELTRHDAGLTIFEKIYHGNLVYIEAYSKNADVFLNLIEAARLSKDIERLHYTVWQTPADRIRRHIIRELESGNTSRQVDADVAASALCAMLDAFCYRWFGVHHIAIPLEEQQRIAYELSIIWYMSLYGSALDAELPLQGGRPPSPSREASNALAAADAD